MRQKLHICEVTRLGAHSISNPQAYEYLMGVPSSAFEQ